MVLGVLWYPVSYLAVTTLFAGGWNGAAFLVMVLVATAFITVGVGLLIYGAFSPPQPARN